MAQRFFLDGINLQRSRRTVTETVKLPAAIHANVAEPSLPSMNVAMPRTQIAVNFSAGFRFPPARFMQLFSWGFGFLKDRQFIHGRVLDCNFNYSACLPGQNREVR